MLEHYADAPVLVVDDDRTELALVERLLVRRGLRNVHCEPDRRRALARLDALDPALVLLEPRLSSPDGPRDGLDLLESVRRWAAGTYLPVVVLTGDTSATALEAALAHGATDFLTKPFNATEIVLRIRNLLQTRELCATLQQHIAGAGAELDRAVGLCAGRDDPDARTRERIRAVLADGDFGTVFQPVVDLADTSVVGYEALSRFSPGTPGTRAWFTQASGVGLSADLETAAARRALVAAAGLPSGGFVALNVSPATLVAGRLADLPLDDVVRAGSSVVVELTEHVPVSDYAALAAAFAPLREAGARLALDGTGAGFAGLRHLIRLDPDVIKLDISLVAGIEADPARRALIAALLSVAGDIGAQVVAEGVETTARAAALATLGVRWAQGWLYGRPAPAEQWAQRRGQRTTRNR
jgi:EAL domain-containing protein (putative c-di-GMP-specific phosphodiesterase class I)/CheY-like chemotaxis protein